MVKAQVVEAFRFEFSQAKTKLWPNEVGLKQIDSHLYVYKSLF